MRFRLLVALASVTSCFSIPAFATTSPPHVEIRENRLFVDGVSQPQLYGAELQYFRLRGGPGRNIPRAKVIELWARALDHMVEAGMNSISFYIPWDFHEYAEGKFDFTGTVDEDGDGNPDYPSRDVITFFKMVEARGIRRIMVRPGPYINAEWGFLGFGAIPLWFHEKYPDSHMRSPEGRRTKLYDYHNPDLLEHAKTWFQTLHREVLQSHLGSGKPILFLQLDNETNFMWQSIFNHDYGIRAIDRYIEFLKGQYLDLNQLNQAQHSRWRSWEEVRAPEIPGVNLAADRDWYRFQDESIHSYLSILRGYWEQIGVREPDILFTLAESYNALGNGLLPNFSLRNDPGKTGMMTLNLYPKTYETTSYPLMNLPFKADHDVIAMDEASDHYLGNRQEWLLGPEIQGGWWRGIDVTPASRQQTYLSSIGHGLKALFVYYFTEGDNWQSGWAKKQLEPLFTSLAAHAEYSGIPTAQLPPKFWQALQDLSDRQLFLGLNVQNILNENEHEGEKLYFDAPLDADARPRAPFALLKTIGQQIVAPHADFLAAATEISDPVTVIKDSDDHAPSPLPGFNSLLMNAEWCGGLVGYLMQTGVNPRIFHWGLGDLARLNQSQVILRQDSGTVKPDLARYLSEYIRSGGTVINLLADSMAQSLGFAKGVEADGLAGPVVVTSRVTRGRFDAAAKPLFYYELAAQPTPCEELLRIGSHIIAYRCRLGKGFFIQIGGLFYDAFNSDYYGELADVPARQKFLTQLLTDAGVQPQVRIAGGGDRVVAFARSAGPGQGLWVTVKNGRREAVKTSILLGAPLIANSIGKSTQIYATAMLAKTKTEVSPSQLSRTGLEISLPAEGSESYFLTDDSH